MTRGPALEIGPFRLASRALLAPMAGVTDRPFRALCRRFGAALAASEMLSSDVRLWSTAKSRRRLDHDGEPRPRVVQLAGVEPATMAEAARRCVDAGADIVDVNMGCPAKKVCNRLAGSALLRDEPLVARILESIVRAVDAPVTLKTRTGWDPANRNGPRIARIAEQCGVQAIAIHGRTRADLFRGAAEYDTIREIKAAVRIPVIANGDIDSGARARAVLAETGCDAVMIGRAAQGAPWIFEEVNFFLAHGENPGELPPAKVRDIMRAHLEDLYSFYGEETGVRMARKHLSWYCRRQPADGDVRSRVMREETAQGQLAAALTLFERASIARN
ncbi:MAG: tRNA dihydrouridine synthase DusB [Gammaproteobacteria bacterium]|nr:tRNA dihydrouridine synthase DusB [Gammaproteobacteria bacterium]